MTETAALVIKVDSSGAARATGHLKDLERAAGSTERSAHKLGKAWGTAVGLIGSAAVAGAVTNYIKLADTYALMTARLGMVTKGAEGLKQAQGDLFKLAQESRSSLEGVTDLYTKLANSSENLRGNHEKLLGVTTNVSKALTLSGADAASATAVIRQFSQAMASGALRGDEFVSVMEGAPRLARAIADGLNVPIGALRKMAAEGKLTADTVIRALESQGQVIDREFRNMPLTVGGAVQQVRNSLMQLVGDTETATGASKDLAGAISDLAGVLASDGTKQGFATIVNGVTSIIAAMANALPAIAEFGDKLGGALFLADRYIETTQKLAGARIEHTIQSFGQAPWAQTGTAAGARHNEILAQWERDKRMVMGDLTGANDRTASALTNIKGGLPYLNGGRGSSVLAQPGGGMWMMRPGASAEVASGGAPFKPTATGGGGRKGASRSASNEMQAQRDAARELKRAQEEAARASDDFMRRSEDLAATIGGPLAEANLRYKRDLADLEDLAKRGKVSDEDLIAAKRDLAAQHKKTTDGINSQKTATQQLIEDMQFELSLIGMTNVERAKAIAGRQADRDATAEQRAEIDRLAESQVRASDAAQIQIQAMDEFRRGASDALVDFVTGAKSAQTALKDFADDMAKLVTRMIAEQWMQKLFGQNGTTGSNTQGGGWVGNVLGMLFGGGAGWGKGGFGFSEGGFTGYGGVLQPAGVVHKGEVVFSQSDVARAGGVAAVEAMRKGGGRSGTTIINVNVPRGTSYRTADQVAMATGAAQRRANVRSR